MNRPFGTQRSIIHHWQKYNGGYCFNKYSTIKKEIEEKIDNFYKIQNRNLHQEWDQINKAITAGNAVIQDCVRNGHKLNDLYAVDTIKNFIERCSKHNAPTCGANRASQVRKYPALKISGAGNSCGAGKGCKEGIAQAKEKNGKSQSRALEEGSKTVRSPRTDPKYDRQNNPIEQEPGNTNIISQLQPSVSRSDPHVVAEVKELGQRDNGVSTSSNREESQVQPLPSLGPSKENTFETSTRDQQLQTVTTVKSDTGDSSQVRISGENTPKGKLPVGDNSHVQQDNIEQVLNREPNENPPPPNHDTVYSVEIAPSDGNPANRVSISVSTDGFDSARASFPEQPRDTVTAETIPGVVANSNIADPDGKSHMGDDSANRPADSDVSPVKTACTEASSDQASGSETPCSKREDGELVTSAGYILEKVHEFFDAIPNKEHVIKASAPMGIVLLLGLLFKYTPLWRVLTKKNRKKGAVINEELNSVLQEPSIIDDERSIPFSYGAFEYSSFDQNSY
ncbi:PIR protein [Plasmodium vivax]|uniref:VIR protein n=1 Tax=Plasmodium vivax TaxID=5855 RepID=A0A564ZQE4_PLAVI|nr:PIR protein [Plasmodium vivax]